MWSRNASRIHSLPSIKELPYGAELASPGTENNDSKINLVLIVSIKWEHRIIQVNLNKLAGCFAEIFSKTIKHPGSRTWFHVCTRTLQKASVLFCSHFSAKRLTAAAPHYSPALWLSDLFSNRLHWVYEILRCLKPLGVAFGVNTKGTRRTSKSIGRFMWAGGIERAEIPAPLYTG